jgi:hypothetical protein
MADHFDFRVHAKPLSGRIRRAIRQHVDNLPPLEVDNRLTVSATGPSGRGYE